MKNPILSSILTLILALGAPAALWAQDSPTPEAPPAPTPAVNVQVDNPAPAPPQVNVRIDNPAPAAPVVEVTNPTPASAISKTTTVEKSTTTTVADTGVNPWLVTMGVVMALLVLSFTMVASRTRSQSTTVTRTKT